MLTKRRVRFSVVTMLVFMTGIAVLLNHEVRRSKAIEMTVKRIEQWNGSVDFRTRTVIPTWLASVLPQYWSQEIDTLYLTLYTKDIPRSIPVENHYSKVDSQELEAVLEFGALDNLTSAILWGSTINRSVVSRICKSPSMETCVLHEAMLSESEFQALRKSCPRCKIYNLTHVEKTSDEILGEILGDMSDEMNDRIIGNIIEL